MSLFALFLPQRLLDDLTRIANAATEQAAQTKRIANLLESSADTIPDEIGQQLDAATSTLQSSTDSLKGAVDSNQQP
jgi:hypothetical protein